MRFCRGGEPALKKTALGGWALARNVPAAGALWGCSEHRVSEAGSLVREAISRGAPELRNLQGPLGSSLPPRQRVCSSEALIPPQGRLQVTASGGTQLFRVLEDPSVRLQA